MAHHTCSGCGVVCDCGGYEECDLCEDCFEEDRPDRLDDDDYDVGDVLPFTAPPDSLVYDQDDMDDEFDDLDWDDEDGI